MPNLKYIFSILGGAFGFWRHTQKVCLRLNLNKTDQWFSTQKNIFIEFPVWVNYLEITCENMINKSIYQIPGVLKITFKQF